MSKLLIVSLVLVVPASLTGCAGPFAAPAGSDGASGAPGNPGAAPTAGGAPASVNSSDAPGAPTEWSAREEGWVTPSTGPDAFLASHNFPVERPARNASVVVEMISSYPHVGRLPRETADVLVELVGPSGKVLAKGHRDVTSQRPDVHLDVKDLHETGDHTVRLTIRGGSDGAETGDKYVLTIHVRY